MCIYMLMRDAEGWKNEASKAIQTTKQTQHTQDSHSSHNIIHDQCNHEANLRLCKVNEFKRIRIQDDILRI